MDKRWVKIAIGGLFLLLLLGYLPLGLIMAQNNRGTTPQSAPQQDATAQPNAQPTTATTITNTITNAQPAPSAALQPYQLIFSGDPGPDVDTLQDITKGATSDHDILQKIVNYYYANKDRLSTLWRETNPTRLAGIFTMYIVHISTIYGAVPVFPTSLSQYLAQPRAECGTYTWAAMQIADALGLTRRTVEFVGEHAWLEIQVDGQWEAFDSTTNTWLSRGVDQLMQGMPREYRQFYTPMLDPTRPDARLHIAEGWNMQVLRQKMPGVGITYMPPGQLKVGGVVSDAPMPPTNS